MALLCIVLNDGVWRPKGRTATRKGYVFWPINREADWQRRCFESCKRVHNLPCFLYSIQGTAARGETT
jgi:hypothetical protein